MLNMFNIIPSRYELNEVQVEVETIFNVIFASTILQDIKTILEDRDDVMEISALKTRSL